MRDFSRNFKSQMTTAKGADSMLPTGSFMDKKITMLFHRHGIINIIKK